MANSSSTTKKSNALFSVRTLLIVGALFVAAEAYVISTKSGSPTFNIPAVEVASLEAIRSGQTPEVSLSPLPPLMPSQEVDTNVSPYGFQMSAGAPTPQPVITPITPLEVAVAAEEEPPIESQAEPLRAPASPGLSHKRRGHRR